MSVQLSYKTVYNHIGYALFFVAKAEKGRREEKGLDREIGIWYNDGAVDETASQKASGRRGRKNRKKVQETS